MISMKVKQKDGTVVKVPLGFLNNTNSADGRGIVSIDKTGVDMTEDGRTIDTYTITYSDSTTSTFIVTNGKNGNNGTNGLSIWAATIEHDTTYDETTLKKSQILGVDEREIQLNDLIMYTDGKIGKVVEVLENNVTTSFTGIDLGVNAEASGGELPTFKVVQTTGDSEEDVMSQKAVTELFKNVGLTEEEKAEIKADNIAFITEELAKRGQLKPEFANDISECEDTSKLYILPDGFIYAYMQTTVVGGSSYTNRMTAASMGADQAVGWVEGGGYTQNARLSGSTGAVSTEYTTVQGMCVSGYIPAKAGDVIRIKGFYAPEGVAAYVVSYKGTTMVKNKQFKTTDNGEWREDTWYTLDTTELNLGTATFTLNSEDFGSDLDAIRISGCITENTIITVNEEIKEGGGTAIVEQWTNTGHAFVPADYDDEIANLKLIANTHTADISNLDERVSKVENGITNITDEEKLEKIKNWDKPVYDYSPVTLLSDERAKPALTASDRTVDAVYAKYRALMARHPRYITETNLGKSTSSDTFTAVDILRFDFKEPDGLVQSSRYSVNETKPKIILMCGVHNEYAGIYGVYYALEEIAENPEFDDIRRNAHIIVVPCSNPFGLTAQTKIEGWQMSHVNANGVAIHNNFGVEHNTYNANANVGEFNYGGVEPYSELETQYIDRLMAENSDAIAFVSCHNYNNDLVFGSLAIWASSATAYMCNLAFRLIDKISKAWHSKYGSALQEGIETYKTDALPDGETRLGYAQFSTSAGTEQLNATKYGIQATNLEISDNMRAFTNAQFSADVMTHGAEVYANYIRVILTSYDSTDKESYYK